jgi:hypothetical protein
VATNIAATSVTIDGIRCVVPTHPIGKGLCCDAHGMARPRTRFVVVQQNLCQSCVRPTSVWRRRPATVRNIMIHVLGEAY